MNTADFKTPLEDKPCSVETTSEKGELLCTVRRDNKVIGYLAIDSTVHGHSCGGLRMMPNLDETEILSLARSMTLKYGFLGLSQGGAKAGVIGDPEGPVSQRRALLNAFGEGIAPLIHKHIYLPGPDMGTSLKEIFGMLASVGFEKKRTRIKKLNTGYHTALSVFAAVEAACDSTKSRLQGKTVAIEGFGKVGAPLSEMLDRAGAKVVAVSTTNGALYNRNGLNINRLNKVAAVRGSKVVDFESRAEKIGKEELLTLPVDILCPSAVFHTINSKNAPHVRAKIICPGANNPLTQEAEDHLTQRGVLSVPDFVSNSGGVLGGSMQFASVGEKRIEEFIMQELKRSISIVLATAFKEGCTPRQVAERLAMQRFKEIARPPVESLRRSLFVGGIGLYTKGLIPKSVMGNVSLHYFSNTLATNSIRPAYLKG